MLLTQSISRITALSIPLFIILSISSTAWSQKDTLEVKPRRDLGAIRPGDTICTSIPIINGSGSTATITELQLRDTAWHIAYAPSLPLLPYLLGAGDTLFVDVCLIATKGFMEVWAGFQMTYRFPGQEDITTEFSAIARPNSCVATWIDSLDFGSVSEGSKVRREFIVDEFAHLTLILTHVTFKGDLDKRYSLVDLLPITLSPGNRASLTIEFNAEGPLMLHQASMVLHFSELDCKSNPIALTGYVAGPSSGVNKQVEALDPRMFITPNPSKGSVHIELQAASHGEIKIFDALGREVIKNEGMNFNWIRSSIPRETYFVRASGVGENGEPFAITQRILHE